MECKPYERQANYYETDQMGIVHHSNYLRYFEEARLDFMRQAHYSALDLEHEGIIIPTIDAYAKYIRPLHFEDVFTVVVNPLSFTGVRMKFSYEIIRDGELCSTGYTTHCFVDDTMKPIVLRHSNRALYSALTEIFGKAE